MRVAFARGLPTACALGLFAILYTVAPVAAQQQTGVEEAARCGPALVSPLLPQDHWAVRAAHRADAWGLTENYFPAQRSVPLFAVAEALEQATEAAPRQGRDQAEVVRGWQSAFNAEFPGLASGCRGRAEGRGVTLLGGHVAAGYLDWTNAVRPGTPLHGPTPIAPEQGFVGEAGAAFRVGRYVAGAVEPTWGPDGAELDWQVALGAKSLMVSAGHGPVGYGFGRGGVVFSGASRFTHIEASNYQPLHLPGVLRLVGPVSGSAFVGRLYAPQLPGDPFLGGASLGIQPHPRLKLAIHRGVMFGGDSALTPLSALDVLKIASMLYNGEENNVFSFSARYRLPTEGVIPLLGYAEWGADDSSGALHEAPGYVFGLFAPALPGVPRLAAGVEYSWFGYHPTADRPVWYWYENRPTPGPWAAGATPLGHALGGNGSEWMGYVEGDWLKSRLQWNAHLAFRERDPRNLYAPDRAGESTAVAAEVSYRFAQWGQVSVVGYREAAEDWREQRLQLLFSAFGP